MPTHYNAASRLHKLFNGLANNAAYTDQYPALAVWSEAFYLRSTEERYLAYEIVENLKNVRNQLTLIKTGMVKLNFSPILYDSAIIHLEEAISPLFLNDRWGRAKQFLKIEYLTTLSFCSEILPSEETEFPLKDINEIKKLLAELRTETERSQIQGAIQETIIYHLSRMENAVDAYNIRGVKAMQEALVAGLGGVVVNKELFKEHINEPLVSSFLNKLQRFGEFTDTAQKAEFLISYSQKAFDVMQSYFSN